MSSFVAAQQARHEQQEALKQVCGCLLSAAACSDACRMPSFCVSWSDSFVCRLKLKLSSCSTSWNAPATG